MLTREEHERLAQTGPGTPMGELLRRYWHPIAATADLDADPVRPVRLLSENLVLYRDAAGKIGLVSERCAHRGISLAYGIPQENGLRCAYHGWVYNQEGQVVDMPFEPACLPLKITAYPVQELSGLIFAYLGPQPAPLLPRYDLFARNDIDRNVELVELPCNWLQCMDNSLDPVHFEHLHGHYGNYVMSKLDRPPMLSTPRHLKIEFDVFEYGIIKRRLVEGDSEDCDDWQIGHPILFPNILSVGDGRRPNYQIRVPVDDTHTLHIRYQGILREEGAEPKTDVPVKHLSLFNPDGTPKSLASDIPMQDMLAWVAQGPIIDRTAEHLATSDKGVALYHKLLFENAEIVQRGDDPMATVRDVSKNEPMIDIPRERRSHQAFFTFDGVYRAPARPGARG